MRSPFQVIVFPYRLENGELEFLIGKRVDGEYWQAVSGGGENSESPLEAAKRELTEETGLKGSDWIQLDSMCTLPKILYQDHEKWGEVSFVIPEYAFMVCTSGTEVPSEEHSELKWASPGEAIMLLKYDSNRTALWEASQRAHL